MDFGASPAVWQHYAGELGLCEDLLPVVSNPDARLSPDSRISRLGKTPTRYNYRGFVAGIRSWVDFRAAPRDIGDWSAVPDYGICVQTRRVRAFDIDVADVATARRIVAAIETATGFRFPRRYRRGTGKCLLPFRYPPPLTKRVIPVDGGMIEVLATGQQFVAEGTYIDASGKAAGRYLWTDGLPGALPELSEDQFNALWVALVTEFATDAPRIARQRKAVSKERVHEARGRDDQADYLIETATIYDVGEDGRLYLECPFASEHSSAGLTSTVYFPATTGGYAQGHWVCLHAHCMDRDEADFRDACGYTLDGFEDLTEAPPELAPVPAVSPEARVLLDKGATPLLLRPRRNSEPARILRDAKGRPETTMDNLIEALENPGFCQHVLAFDAFQHDVVWCPMTDPEGEEQWAAFDDTNYADLQRILERRGFRQIGIEMLRRAVRRAARDNPVDTAQIWLMRQQWDGVSRVSGFFEQAFGVPASDYATAVSRYLWTALAGRVIAPGCKADMVVTLVGPQGLYKSTALEQLVPHTDFYLQVHLKNKEDDIARLMRGRMVYDIDELRGLRSKSAEEIKAFLSRRYDTWVPKFMETTTRFARRGVFVASTNEDDFLGDATGERRWLPLSVNHADVRWIAANRDQLWAEAANLYVLDGILWQDAERLAVVEHPRYKAEDAWELIIARWLEDRDVTGERTNADNPEGLHASEVAAGALGLSLRDMDNSVYGRVGRVLRRFGFVRGQGRRRNRWFPRKEEASS
jgi:predicted P-loop ATPase